jgi:hypothetical protein
MRLVLAVILTGLFTLQSAAGDELVSIDTRNGVSQGFLLIEPDADPLGTVIMFPPHEGMVRFKRRSSGQFKVKRGGWLGQTVKQFVQSGFVVAVIEPPSDYSGGVDEDFRQSPEHAEDIRHLIAYLRNRVGKKPFLAGTCRSTYSVASVMSKIDNSAVSGAILASSRTKGRKERGPITEGLKNGSVSAPVLFVHHQDDDCNGSPYSMISGVVDFFKSSAKAVGLITVKGGYQNADRKQRRGCGNNGSHKFYGAQTETVEAIVGWMKGENPKPVIDVGS